MDCQQYQDALSAAALGALSGGEAQAFRLHLEICEACRNELARRREFLGVVDRELQTHLGAEPSPDFNARLRRRIAVEPQRDRQPILKWLPLAAGAAVVASVLVVVHMQRRPIANPRETAPVLTASSESEPLTQPIAPETHLLHPVVAVRSSPPVMKVRIDRRELYATVRFTQEIAEGRVDARPLVSASQEADRSGSAKPLQIPILEVPYVQPPSMEENDESGGDGVTPAH